MIVPYTHFQNQFRSQAEEILYNIGLVLDKGDMILGEEVRLFEEEFAQFIGVKHAIGVGNGTDSLIIIMRGLGIGPGDEVITSPNSWISSASSIALIGAKPVFADVGNDQLIDPVAIEKAITTNTKAIMPVHLTGKLCDMEAINKIGDQYGVPILEDAAQSVGTRNAGSSGLAGSFSLHPLKNLAGVGDAGIITTNDENLAQRLRSLRNHGLKNRDCVERWGLNSRLDSIQATVLRLRLKRLPEVISRRKHLAGLYGAALSGHCGKPNTEDHTYHTYTVQCDARDVLKRHLAAQGIETKIHYPIPIHLQECAKDLGYKEGDFPNAEAQAKRILSLPINEFLTEEQINYTCEKINEFYN